MHFTFNHISQIEENLQFIHNFFDYNEYMFVSLILVSSRLPSTWVTNRVKHQIFLLDSSSTEYNDVVAFFLPTIAAKLTKIIKIERIQRKTWYLQYQIMKKEYRERLGDENEKRLFHGCSEESVNSIIKSNFN